VSAPAELAAARRGGPRRPGWMPLPPRQAPVGRAASWPVFFPPSPSGSTVGRTPAAPIQKVIGRRTAQPATTRSMKWRHPRAEDEGAPRDCRAGCCGPVVRRTARRRIGHGEYAHLAKFAPRDRLGARRLRGRDGPLARPQSLGRAHRIVMRALQADPGTRRRWRRRHRDAQQRRLRRVALLLGATVTPFVPGLGDASRSGTSSRTCDRARPPREAPAAREAARAAPAPAAPAMTAAARGPATRPFAGVRRRQDVVRHGEAGARSPREDRSDRHPFIYARAETGSRIPLRSSARRRRLRMPSSSTIPMGLRRGAAFRDTVVGDRGAVSKRRAVSQPAT